MTWNGEKHRHGMAARGIKSVEIDYIKNKFIKPTPWGTADGGYQIAKGIYWVYTPSHGGIMISKGLARKILSPEALKLGIPYGGYLSYEEDCDYSVVLYELYTKFGIKDPQIETENYEEKLLNSLSRWNTRYLLSTNAPEKWKEIAKERLENKKDL